jgi:succinate dehydrogenase / fumarate reductase iron-sulfur subunit
MVTFMKDTVNISVFRFDPLSDKEARFDNYTIPARGLRTVMDALMYVRDHKDGTLAFRSSCRQGRCGSCAVHFNGRYGLACEMPLSEGKNQVRPLAQLPVIKDLVVDMERFWEKYEAVKPYLVRSSNDAVLSLRKRLEMDKLFDCILCGACFSACLMTGKNPDFHGPAAYAILNRFLLDDRDALREQRLALVKGENGVFRCHQMFNCNEACPKKIYPSENILEIIKIID